MLPYSLFIIKKSYSSAVRMPNTLNLRGCHSLWRFFPKPSAHNSVPDSHHISTPFARQDSVCPVPRSFALLTASRMLSSPAGTKIFQFPACACATIHGAIGYPGFNVRLATTPGLSQLATAFDAVRAKPSSRWLKNFVFFKLASPQINRLSAISRGIMARWL